MTSSSPNPIPDAPGLVEYRGLDAVAEARHYPSRLDIKTVEYDTSPERAEAYLAAGGNPENVRFRRGIDPEAEDTFVLEQLRKVPDRLGDAAWLETFEQDIELGMDVLLASVERLVAKGVLEYVGRDRGKHATVRFVDPADVPPTAVEIDFALSKFFHELNDPEASGLITLGDSRRLFLRALLAADPRTRDERQRARKPRV